MAKVNKTVSYKNAVISKEDMTITEFGKDFTKTYCLKNLLEEWDGIESVSLTIRMDDELPEDIA
jgi:hypothetical protein